MKKTTKILTTIATTLLFASIAIVNVELGIAASAIYVFCAAYDRGFRRVF